MYLLDYIFYDLSSIGTYFEIQAFYAICMRTVYSHLSNKRDVTLTDYGKFHPAQNENPPCMFIDFITELSIFLQKFQSS